MNHAWWERYPVGDTAWMGQAACREIGGEFWHPQTGDSVTVAKRVCNACEVRSDCLEYALRQPGIEGILGGTTPRERAVILKRRRLAA